MLDLTTAGAVTKFLRSKDGSIGDIISTSNKLLSGELDVYLPNKVQFLFDLLCDRLNDNSTKQFKSWKFEPEIWLLFSSVWDRIQEDATSKKVAARKLKLVDVLIAVFSQKPSELLLVSIHKVLDNFINSAYIVVEENSAIVLLGTYLTAVNSVAAPIKDSQAIIDFSNSIKFIYDFSRTHVSHKQNKKLVTKFFTECLPPALSFQVQSVTDSGKIIASIVNDTLFDEEVASLMNQNVKQLFAEHANLFDEPSVSLFFHSVIESLSAKNIKTCEDIFVSITKASKFAHMSENLLRLLAGANRSLSHEFFTSLYEEETKENSVNWKLISYIIELDPELALKFYVQILQQIRSSKSNEEKLLIGTRLVDSFIKTREFTLFLNTVWPNSIQDDKFWKSSEYVDVVSQRVNNLSLTQLKVVISSQLQESTFQKNLPITIALIKGLLSCQKLKIDSTRDLFLEYDLLFLGKSDESWEAKYYLLCLFGDQLLDNSTLLSTFEKPSKSKYYYYSVFRYIEISGLDSLKFDFKTGFITFVKNTKGQELKNVLGSVLERWSIVVSEFFSKDQNLTLIKLIFKHLDWDSYLLPYFRDRAGILFEQDKISSCLNSYILSELDKPNTLQLICLVPVQVIDKHSKKLLIEGITKSSILSQDTDINILSRKALLHLLSQSSVSSSIETDFQTLIVLFDSASTSSKKKSQEILKLVWNDHLNQINDGPHKSYIASSLQALTKHFKKESKIKGIDSWLQIGLVVLELSAKRTIQDKEIDQSRSTLLETFISFITKKLQKARTDDIIWYLDALYSLLDFDSKYSSQVSELIATLGENIADQKYNNDSLTDIKSSLFRLLVKISDTSRNSAIFVLSLYICLSSSLPESYNALSNYIERLSSKNEVFETIYNIVIDTIQKDSKSENSLVLTEILVMFIRNLRKAYSKTHSQLFLQSLSLAITNYQNGSMVDSSSVELLLTTLKDNLSDSIWLYNQYSIELTLTYLNLVALDINKFEDNAVTVFVLASQVFSHILLFHRFRLNSRHHIIIAVFSTMVQQLSIKQNNKRNVLGHSDPAAIAYARLLSNLCEPPSNHGPKELAESVLSSSSALIKKSLRSHLHILLSNYIFIQLNFNFDSKVNSELLHGIYKVFDVLSKKELQLVNLSIDNSGKAYYKTLYANYKDYGKWKDE